MSDNINNIWVLRLIDNDGNEIKSLNVPLPNGITINYVDITQKMVNEKVTIATGPKKTPPIVAKAQEVLAREASPPPTMMPIVHRHPPIGYHYAPPPAYPGYPHHLNYGQTYLSPVPQHAMHHPMFLSQSPPSQSSQPHPLANVSSTLKEEEIKQPNVETAVSKPKQKKVQEKKNTNACHEIALQPFKDDLIEDEPQSPLPDKDFERKPPKGKVSTTFAKVVASFTPDPKEIPKEPKIKPPPAPKKPQKDGKLSEKYEKGYEPAARKQLRFSKPTIESITIKGDDLTFPDGYGPHHEHYPNLGNFNFFAFDIPERYKDSELAETYPQTFKYRLIANAVGLDNMKKVQAFWQNKSDDHTGFHIDFDPVKQFYFSVFYHMRAVYLEDGSYINKCHIFNRFRSGKNDQTCYYGESCDYYHMCMICGSPNHSAFQRKAKDDRSYVCEEHAKLVDERRHFAREEITDQTFIDEIIHFDNESENPTASSSSDDMPKTVYADQSLSASPVITAPSATVFASTSSPSDSSFPPLSASPARKKKNKKNKKPATSTPQIEVEIKSE